MESSTPQWRGTAIRFTDMTAAPIRPLFTLCVELRQKSGNSLAVALNLNAGHVPTFDDLEAGRSAECSLRASEFSDVMGQRPGEQPRRFVSACRFQRHR